MSQIYKYNWAYIGPADNAEDALDRLEQHHDYVAIDTETIALKGDKSTTVLEWDEEREEEITVKAKLDAKTMIGVGIAISETEAFYFPKGNGTWKNVPECNTSPIEQVLENEDITKVFFNSMFDLDRINDAFGIVCKRFADVAIMCQVQGLWNSLDQNSGWILQEDHVVIDDVLRKGKTMLDVPYPVTAKKCMEDCMTTLKLFHIMKGERWRKEEGFVWEDRNGFKHDVTPEIINNSLVDHTLIPLLRKMSRRGIKVRRDVVEKWYEKLTSEIALYDEYFATQGINPMSNHQVGRWLVSRGHYLPLTESRKHLRVDEEIILGVANIDPAANMVLSRRHRQKLLSTYIIPTRNVDRITTHFRLGLATGRLASSEINIQNQPPSMREIYAPDNEAGVWSWMDLHQAEMRVWAAQAKDEVMLDAFASGSSPHETTLHTFFPGKPKKNPDGSQTEWYVASKGFNFALLADASAEVLAKTTKQTVELARKYKEELYKLYWRTAEHQEFMRHRKQPWHMPDYVEDDYGRRCHIPDMSSFTTAHHQEKCRLNYPFQASVAGASKRTMINLDLLGYDIPIQVHDAVLADGDIDPEHGWPEWIERIDSKVRLPFEGSRSSVWV